MATKRHRSARKAAARRAPRPRVEASAAVAGDSGVFVIMLDDLLRIHPRHFPITAQSDNVETLQATSQHDGRFVLIPRGTSSAELLDNKDLRNAVSGEIDEGGIYRIVAR